MAQAVVLFNGIQYSFSVVERAVAWAKQSGGSLICIFLRTKEEASEGYLFLSDLDAAENLRTASDATSSHGSVVESNVRMLEHLLRSEQIEFTTEVLTDPTPQVITEKIAGSDILFTSDKVHEAGILSAHSIDLHDWLKNADVRVEIIKS